jgi:hypothetical protein
MLFLQVVMIMQRLCKSSASAKDDADIVAVAAPF